MTRYQFGLALGNLGEFTFEDFGDASVQCPPWFAK
jgi:hypothetical protein